MKKHLPIIALVLLATATNVNAQNAVTFSSSNLPIFLIDTHGVPINETDKITADLGVVYNGEGMRNDTADVFNNYSGKMGIDIRGSSSAWFPKKQYGVELRMDNGVDSAVALLDFPKESDWVFFAPYNDKSLMRDVLTYKLGRDMGHYAPRTKYVEVVMKQQINDGNTTKTQYVYQGLYVLIEKIKRDKNRVDISKLTPDKNTGDDVTGGYLLKIDKVTGNSGPGWYSNHAPDNGVGQQTYFQYEYPKWTDISAAQRNYIRDYVNHFEDVLAGNEFKDKNNGYAKYIDVESFIDFFIMQEVTRNVDGYRLSTFLHKQRDSKGGKLVMGPLWDFNLGLGNADYCSGWKTTGWMYSGFNDECNGDGSLVPFWWRRLLEDTNYRNKLSQRWTELRAGKFATSAIFERIDSITTLLNAEAAPRNFQAWPVLGQYVWPNYFVGQTFNSEVDYLKSWIDQRMTWLDNNMPDVVTANEKPIEWMTASCYPNPVDRMIEFDFYLKKPGDVNIEIVDATGNKLLTLKKTYHNAGEYHETVNAYDLKAGVHFAKIRLNNEQAIVRKIVKTQ